MLESIKTLFCKPPAMKLAQAELDEALRQHLQWSTQAAYAKLRMQFYEEQIKRLSLYVESAPKTEATFIRRVAR